MTDTVWQTPSHRREKVKGFGDLSKHDYDQAGCAD
jgi:hypothetical protein